jgi:hypothetical protein
MKPSIMSPSQLNKKISLGEMNMEGSCVEAWPDEDIVILMSFYVLLTFCPQL